MQFIEPTLNSFEVRRVYVRKARREIQERPAEPESSRVESPSTEDRSAGAGRSREVLLKQTRVDELGAILPPK
jgi:hypothetical protein